MVFLVVFLVCAFTAAVGATVLFYRLSCGLAEDLAATRVSSLQALDDAYRVADSPKITRDMRRPGVYLIKAQGWVKIGRASDVGSRLDDYRTAIPRGFEIVTVFYCANPKEVESRLHRRFARQRRRGEWFYLPEEAQEQLRREAEAAFKALSA